MLKPGPDLDAEIAKKVFKHKIISVSYCGDKPQKRMIIEGASYDVAIPWYSTNPAAAWKVVEKLRDEFGSVMVTQQKMTYVEVLRMHGENILVSADTMPHAVCLAALETLGE